jgi:FMN phosphatase YigB (HAD superfamily)
LADYLGSLQEFRAGLDDNPKLLDMSQFLLEYPFTSRLFPRALEAIAHLRTLGSPVVLSDGDIVFQPRKILRSGIWDAVEGRVMIYLHKEKVLDHVQRRFPARHYVMVDDKANLLAAMKAALGGQLTTVFVRQGHYALAAESNSAMPAPDLVIERIGDLLNHNLTDFKVGL